MRQWLRQVLPEEVAPVDDLACAHMEEVDGEHRVLIVVPEDIGIFIVGGGDALLVEHLVHGDELVAQPGGEFELLGCRGLRHAAGEARLQFAGFAGEEELHVVDGLRVGLGRGEAFHARSKAALDVVLQARTRVVA